MNAGRPSLTIAALTLTLLAPPVADSQSAKVARVGLRTARVLGLTIPPSVLARADELIQ